MPLSILLNSWDLDAPLLPAPQGYGFAGEEASPEEEPLGGEAVLHSAYLANKAALLGATVDVLMAGCGPDHITLLTPLTQVRPAGRVAPTTVAPADC